MISSRPMVLKGSFMGGCWWGEWYRVRWSAINNVGWRWWARCVWVVWVGHQRNEIGDGCESSFITGNGGDLGPFSAEFLYGSVEISSSTWTEYKSQNVSVGYGGGSGVGYPDAFSLGRSRNRSSEAGPVRWPFSSKVEELLRNRIVGMGQEMSEGRQNIIIGLTRWNRRYSQPQNGFPIVFDFRNRNSNSEDSIMCSARGGKILLMKLASLQA